MPCARDRNARSACSLESGARCALLKEHSAWAHQPWPKPPRSSQTITKWQPDFLTGGWVSSRTADFLQQSHLSCLVAPSSPFTEPCLRRSYGLTGSFLSLLHIPPDLIYRLTWRSVTWLPGISMAPSRTGHHNCLMAAILNDDVHRSIGSFELMPGPCVPLKTLPGTGHSCLRRVTLPWR